MSEAGRGSWGREDPSWWAGGEQLQQQALLAQQEDAARTAANAAHQLFSYKMAASPPAAYDYRVGMGGLRAAPGDPPHWWYSAGVDSLHQPHQLQLAATSAPSPTHQQQGQQNQHSSQQNSQQAVTQQSQNQQQVLQQQLQSAQQRIQSAQQQIQSQQQQLQQSQQQQQQLQSQQQQQQIQSQQLQQQHLQQQQLQQQQLQQQQQHHQLGQGLHQPQVTPKSRMPRGKADMKPRGRMTAYAFFVQTCREEHKKKHPDENVIFAAFSKKCAERWKMLDKEKQRFHEMAERDKKRYDLEMQSYVPPKGEKVGRGRKRKQIKDPNAPKRSLSAFFWFCNDERSKVKAINPEYGVGDIAKELGRRWADCDPEAKSKYEALSEKDKARYDREMTAYKKKPKPVVPVPEEEEEEEAEEDEFE